MLHKVFNSLLLLHYMRKPIVAGQFYPADKTELREQIKSYIKQDGKVKDVRAAIVPHAGYVFSGKCAARVYSVLPEAETYIIIGVNHSGFGENIALSLEDFETPLGIVNNDIKLGEEILEQLNIQEDNEAHKYEHSIEVQLPFLQETQENFKIISIILKNYTLSICKKLAKAIYEAGKRLKRKIILIASSDFTHAGPAYGFSGKAKKLDRDAINEILKLDTKKFLEKANKTTICGAGPITTIIEFSKLAQIKESELLEYYTSADIMPSENEVGYAAIIFY